MHADKHVVKMILEYAQLLSTAHRVLDGRRMATKTATGRNTTRYLFGDPMHDAIFYQATHINHPSAVWVRESHSNYNWLYSLFYALCKEYTYRYGKVHLCEQKLIHFLKYPPKNIPKRDFTEPTPAMPDQYKVKGDSIASYRNYYMGGKQHLAKWSNRTTPLWYNSSCPFTSSNAQNAMTSSM